MRCTVLYIFLCMENLDIFISRLLLNKDIKEFLGVIDDILKNTPNFQFHYKIRILM